MWYTTQHPTGCENLPCSPELAAGSLADGCSNGGRCAPLKSPTIHGASSCSVSETESSDDSRSGTMSRPSTEPPGAERSTSSAADSPARTSALPERDSGLKWGSGAGFGKNMPALFAKFDRATSLWRTAQCSFLEGLDEFSETWPKQGMMRRGACYPLRIAAHHTSASGCGLSERFPTPTVWGNYNRKGISPKSGDGLATYVRRWPTPCASDWRGPGKNGAGRDRLDYAVEKGFAKRHRYPTPQARDFKAPHRTRDESSPWKNLNDTVWMMDGEDGGRLNPNWVEWLMGWPIGWTELRPLETGKFRLWLRGRF